MISYDALEIEGLKEVLGQISTACARLNIDFFIVGAVARNIWYVQGNKEVGGTMDIDFGVYVADEDTYNRLKQYLIKEYLYTQAYENIFGLNTPDEKRVDLLPFGAIADEGEVIIRGKGLTKINLVGFEEAYQNGSINTTIENETYKACSIPGIVILKLIAYDDKPDRRIKDIIDITHICKYYADIETEMIWEEHSDLYSRNITHDQAGMIVLGRLMKRIVKENQVLLSRLINILQDAIDGKTDILEHMMTDSVNETLEEKAQILNFIKLGLTE